MKRFVILCLNGYVAYDNEPRPTPRLPAQLVTDLNQAFLFVDAVETEKFIDLACLVGVGILEVSVEKRTTTNITVKGLVSTNKLEDSMWVIRMTEAGQYHHCGQFYTGPGNIWAGFSSNVERAKRFYSLSAAGIEWEPPKRYIKERIEIIPLSLARTRPKADPDTRWCPICGGQPSKRYECLESCKFFNSPGA